MIPPCTADRIHPSCTSGSHAPPYPKYAFNIPYPITLPLIVARIKKEYYHHSIAVVADLQYLYDNVQQMASSVQVGPNRHSLVLTSASPLAVPVLTNKEGPQRV